MTINQLLKNKRKRKKRKSLTPRLEQCPQKAGICKKLFIVSPKKPNSANRRVAKVFLTDTKRTIIAALMGYEVHGLQRFSKVLIRGAALPDIPGVHYKIIRGVRDYVNGLEKFNRRHARSKYGLKTKLIRNKKF